MTTGEAELVAEGRNKTACIRLLWIDLRNSGTGFDFASIAAAAAAAFNSCISRYSRCNVSYEIHDPGTQSLLFGKM